MSHDWGYVCVAHDPPIHSEDWFNHGEDLLRAVLLTERAGDWPDDPAQTTVARKHLGPDPAPVEHNGYETTAPILWLREHPRCEVVLRGEDGEVMLPDGTTAMGRVRRDRKRPVRGPRGIERWETVPFPEPPERLCGCPDGGTPMGPTSAPGYLALRPADGWIRCATCRGLIV